MNIHLHIETPASSGSRVFNIISELRIIPITDKADIPELIEELSSQVASKLKEVEAKNPMKSESSNPQHPPI